MPRWTDKKRVNKIRKDSKFSQVPTIPIVRNLVALGFTEVDIGIVLGVSEATINQWKARYPDLFEAHKEGKKILKGILVAQMFRAATGYDYEEQDETYEEVVNGLTGTDGKPETHKALTKTVVHKKHQPGNAALMTFLSNNLLPVDFPRTQAVTENNILTIIGDVESSRLKLFAGRLLELQERKQVDSVEVPNEHQSG